MDEGMLNDLLECSVCLERLDTSSKVLPCQHTFCKKCLEEIVTTHKELRCPECRILVEVKIEDLPPNVLLMRILEGMRNAPKKQQRGTVRGNVDQHSIVQTNQITPQTQQPVPAVDVRSQLSNKSPQQTNPNHLYVRAVYDYLSKEPDDLSFKKGDIILIRKRIDTHWYFGECNGKQGVFPLTYVQIVTSLPSHAPLCKALYDFRMTGEDEEGCLAFNKGAIISVIRRIDENWAEGRLNDRVGIFPLAFVELNALARSLMKLSTNSQPGPSRVAPPTPTTEDSTPLIPTDHSNTVASTPVARPGVQNTTSTVVVGSESSSTLSSSSPSTTPQTSSSNTSSTSSTAPSSPTSPPPARNATNVNSPPPRPAAPHILSVKQPSQREKRHSFSTLNSGHHHHTSHRHSAEIVSSSSEPNEHANSERHKHTGNSDLSAPPVPSPNSTHSTANCTTHLPAAYIALYPYKPQKDDELELRKGAIYMVSERCQDGWFKGTSNRTQKCGVFPGNYVTLARGIPRGTSSSLPQTSVRSSCAPPSEPRITVTYTRSGKPVSNNSLALSNSHRQTSVSLQPPELPPRSSSPVAPVSTVSCSWHGQPDSSSVVTLGRSQSAVMSSALSPSANASTGANITVGKPIEKSKDRKEKGTVSLMRRLTNITRSKSPPPATYSMDNPVFEDTTVVCPSVPNPAHPVHVRSGSCPSQLLQAVPQDQVTGTSHHRLQLASTGTGSQRLKHKERPPIVQINSMVHASRHGEGSSQGPTSSPSANHHRKSNSLDASSKSKTSSLPVRERFRCIVPYPPNSEYELELRLHDIIYVHKKREDGWYKGTQQRTGRTGLFPASFVESF